VEDEKKNKHMSPLSSLWLFIGMHLSSAGIRVVAANGCSFVLQCLFSTALIARWHFRYEKDRRLW
jgi:hypothetical protein